LKYVLLEIRIIVLLQRISEVHCSSLGLVVRGHHALLRLMQIGLETGREAWGRENLKEELDVTLGLVRAAC